MTKVVLFKLPDELAKADDGGDLELDLSKAELDRLCAQGLADPEIQALVRKTMADPSRPTAAVRKGPERVELRKDGGMGATPARTSGRSLEQLDADLAAAVATNQAIDAEKALARRDVAAARAILKADPRAYEAFQARAAGREYRVPVEVAKAEPDYTAEIKRAARSGDREALKELLHKPGGYAQYRRLLAAGELVPPRRAA